MNKKVFVYGQYMLMILIVLLSLSACVKCIFFGLNIDEEYAITMAYRMLGDDSMFYTMWEPHQTSGFVCAFFMKLFLMVTKGSTDYMIIYLRIMGAMLHAGVCIYVYSGLKHICSKRNAFLLSILCFSVLPKWTLIPEFTNILLWVTLCMMSCFLQIQHIQSVPVGRFIFLGILTCIGVLAYPSFLICFIMCCVGIYFGMPNKRRQGLVVYISTCIVTGVFYIIYFVGELGVHTFIGGILQMAADGSHDASFMGKFASNVVALGKCIGVYIVIYALLYALLKLLKKDIKKGTFFGLSMVAILWQFGAWLGDGEYFYEPMFLFYHVFIAIVMSRAVVRKEAWLYIIPPVVTSFATSMLTNTGIYVISFFLLPAIIYGLACLSKQKKAGVSIVIVSLMALFIFAKGWLLCENGGYKGDMNYVKQKALSGPAKNIYCRYLDGYDYNIVQELMDTYVAKDDNVLCISGHTIWYLLGDVNISNYSTISTPTYDERLLEYYTYFPEKYPDVIIFQGIPNNQKVINMFELTEPVVEKEDICLYYTSK